MRKRNDEEHENLDRWLLTYSDLITLLMAFFVILFAMASVDASKFKTLAQSMNIAFGSGGGSGSNMVSNFKGTGISPQSSTSIVTIAENSEFAEVIKLIHEYSSKNGLTKQIQTSVADRGLVVNLADSVLFQSGSSQLSGKSRDVLDNLADILFKTGRLIRVEGHTDNVPIHTARYESNWQLSTDRAANVIMYWIQKYPEQGQKLSAGGYGEYRPIASNDDLEGRAFNRRVEIAVLRESAAKKEPPAPFVP